MGILEQIKDIELEMARTQKNKATESHLGRLKAKIARLKSQIISESSGGGGKGIGFEVRKSGDVRVSLIGFPSAGKSTLLGKMTKTHSETAAYEFTTLTCIPGVIEYRDTEIQLLDLPGIVEGAASGTGRGKQVIATARTSDLILMYIDANKAEVHTPILVRELESVGIRLNKKPPGIYFKKRASGSMNSISFSTTCKLTYLSEKLCKDILADYKIHNAEIVVREDCTVDDFIDVVEGNRVYMRCIFCYSKIDMATIEDIDALSRQPHSICVSVHWELNLDGLLEMMWDYIELVRVYSKKKGCGPDFSQPFVMRRGNTVRDVVSRIHQDLLRNFRYALVWGTSAKHRPQTCGLDHLVEDEDVMQVVQKTGNQLESDRFQLDKGSCPGAGRELKKKK
eukprot:TRINITY_DN2440_c2_g1_i1.p1 TRINITY_DN2440_c2_g1~~TRINITY_DN2440_c2_g1_i1.p1  ORF type:complete len:396 (+),score=134.25 TRINITY_DN2440_c2_g1_i1:112-1299(+)